ncbi:UPF0223 family protein [Amphibacillus cookii]|uniref:UPF0223 family protein n=1 Tax=Amphibacillus cookii TaxID=767787 RepID=UPI0019592F43|nr:UPF0223 family protein [Amphibacillus cookii]MBM7540443.1 uncharacterized protein YktA (UPF0223 family) [Amphibacillus cookii]
MNFRFPIDDRWTTDEIVEVVEFLALIEECYHKPIPSKDILNKYRKFKQIVPSKSEEKTIGRDFERETGYSLYQAIKKAKENSDQNIKMP